MYNLLPILYGLSSTKKIKKWEIGVEETQEGFGDIIVKHGYLDGKIQENHTIIKKGKNIGKKNETTPISQALFNAQSKWNSKKDQNYEIEVPNPETYVSRILLPMLADPFQNSKHRIIYPAYVQPKLNGVRCFAIRKDGQFIFQSRGGKIYTTLEHLIPQLSLIMDENDIFDGEIYYHGWSFQKIVRAVKKTNEDTPLLQFWIYDRAVIDVGYINRYRFLSQVINDDNDDNDDNNDANLIMTPTYTINYEMDVKSYHDSFVQQGFEGVIIRNSNGLYTFDYRSKDLQKYKEFIDKEFEIIGGISGTGLEDKCVIFICENEDGKEFRVRPKGTRELRRKWLDNIQNIIGKQLTVRFQERSEDNIPIFPVGISIRDYE